MPSCRCRYVSCRQGLDLPTIVCYYGDVDTPSPGRYRHFKGGYYEVLGIADLHSGDLDLVIYRSEADGSLHARAIADFDQWVIIEDGLRGRAVPRFERVPD